jgi:hypothetical protein
MAGGKFIDIYGLTVEDVRDAPLQKPLKGCYAKNKENVHAAIKNHDPGRKA